MNMKKPEARHRSENTTSSTDCLRLEYEEYLRKQRGPQREDDLSLLAIG
jgi:hypothetical protein